MKKPGAMRLRTLAELASARRVIASFLLFLVLFLVVNPIWECYDRMDNMRHLGSNGFLVIVLLTACAGIVLFRSLRWFSLHVLSTSSLIAPISAAFLHSHCHDTRLSVLSGDLPLPLRI